MVLPFDRMIIFISYGVSSPPLFYLASSANGANQHFHSFFVALSFGKYLLNPF